MLNLTKPVRHRYRKSDPIRLLGRIVGKYPLVWAARSPTGAEDVFKTDIYGRMVGNGSTVVENVPETITVYIVCE